MKKKVININVLIIVVFLANTLQSCNDLLTEVSKEGSTIDEYYQTIDNLDRVVTAAYRQLVADTWNRGMGGARHRTIFCGADDWTSQPGGNKGDFKEGDQLAIRSSNAAISNVGWSLPYDVILQSNFAIEGIEKLIAKGEKEEAVRALGAEAYFLRAWGYFRLVRLYGPVPLILKSQNDPKDFLVERSTLEGVYAQILEDLNIAIKFLPEKQVERARINKWAGKALRADVYLNMASWPLKQTDKYALALKDAEDIINNGPYVFENEFAPIFFLENEDTNTEYIWQLKFCGDADCPNFGLNTPFASQTTKPAELGGFQDIFIEIAFFNKFPEGARKDYTFLTELNYQDGRVQPWNEFIWKHPFLSKFYDGTVNKNALVESQVTTTAPNSSLDMPMYRITEVMLIYAEAQVMGGGGDQDLALKYLNMVRRRGKGVNPNVNDSDDLVSFTRQHIIDERGWEFLGEMKRWFDLIRTETLAEALSNRDPSELPLLGDPSNHNLYWHPIPDLEIQLNPKLKQNPR